MKPDVERCVAAVEAAPDGFRARARFPRDLDVFRGHFPGYPLVPGVYLLEAVRVAAGRALDRPLRILRVKDARFTAEVAPDTDVEIAAALTRDDRAWHCAATVRAGPEEAATVVLLLQP